MPILNKTADEFAEERTWPVGGWPVHDRPQTRRNAERVATLALGRHNDPACLEQIRGPCNTEPPKATVATMQRWLRAQKPLLIKNTVYTADEQAYV